MAEKVSAGDPFSLGGCGELTWLSQAGLPRLAQNGAGEGSVSEPLPLCPFPLSFLCS